MKKTWLSLFTLVSALICGEAHALTLSYSVEQLNADFERARRDGGGMPRVSKDIQKLMNDLSISVDGVKFVAEGSASGGSCSMNWSGNIGGVVTLKPDTNIQFLIESLKQPIVATVDISGNVDANANLRASAGFRFFGKCVRYLSGQANTKVNANLNMWMSLIVNLNPVYDPVNRKLTLTPNAQLVGEVKPIVMPSVNTDVDASLLGVRIDWLFGGMAENKIDSLINGMISSPMANDYLQQWIAAENIKIQNIIAANASSFQVTLPPKLVDEATRLGLMNLASSALSYPVPWDYLELNSSDLMFAAITNDKASARSVLANAAACTASAKLRSKSMIRTPIYQKVNSVCQVASINDGSSGAYYSDSACSKQTVQLRSYAEICDEHTATGVIGNPASWGAAAVGAQTGWTYSYASQFAIGYDDLSGKTVPFVKRVAFKNITPAYDRTTVGIFDKEAFRAAMADCNKRYYFMIAGGSYSGDVPYCTQIISKDKFYRSMANNVGSSVFNTYKFDYDVSQCVSSLTASYLANPSAYNYKYGISYTYGPAIPESGKTLLLKDCKKQTAEAAGAADRYAIIIDGDGATKVTDPSLHASYVKACAAPYYGAPGTQTVQINGQTLNCSPVLSVDAAAFKIELEKPLLRGNGTCMLEMRVFKKDINATNLKPMIMFHGGSWNRRGFGFAGIESVVNYYTERNYVVFAPFYRLAGDLDANTECNNAYAGDMVKDAMDAYNWVKSNGQTYGAALYAKPSIFGQSAGAYFAGYILGKTTSNDVAKGLLMYPPTDPISYAEGYKKRWQDAQTAGKPMVRSQGDDALEAFMDAKLDWYVSTDSVLKNKFISAANGLALTDLLKSGTGSHAPLYIVHGNQDDLVPVQQSTALCNAMGGSSSAAAGTYACGQNGSSLLVVDKAAHMLDLCIDNVVCPAADKSKASEALNTAKSWFVQ